MTSRPEPAAGGLSARHLSLRPLGRRASKTLRQLLGVWPAASRIYLLNLCFLPGLSFTKSIQKQEDLWQQMDKKTWFSEKPPLSKNHPCLSQAKPQKTLSGLGRDEEFSSAGLHGPQWEILHVTSDKLPKLGK